MKRLTLTLALIMSAFLFFTSCETIDPTPECEREGYGTVIVRNETGFKIEVDVTESGSDYNSERTLYNGGSTTYNRIDAGSIKLWVRTYINEPGYNPFWTDWSYNSEYLSACEEFTYRWYTAYWKKSTEPSLFLDILKNGKVIGTITEFELKTKTIH